MTIQQTSWKRGEYVPDNPEHIERTNIIDSLHCRHFKDVKLVSAGTTFDGIGCNTELHFNNFRPHVAIKIHDTGNAQIPAESDPDPDLEPDLSQSTDRSISPADESSDAATILVAQNAVSKVTLWKFPTSEESENIESCFDANISETITKTTMPSDISKSTVVVWEIQLSEAPAIAPGPHVNLSISSASCLESMSRATTITLVFRSEWGMLDYIEKMSKNLVLGPFYTKFTGGTSFDDATFNCHAIPQPAIGYQQCNRFINGLEYITVMYAGATIDHGAEIEKMKEYQSETRTLILIDNEASEQMSNTRFTGLISAPKQYHNFQIGTPMEITFVDRSIRGKWRATISDPTGIQKEGFMSLFVERVQTSKLLDGKVVSSEQSPATSEAKNIVTSETIGTSTPKLPKLPKIIPGIHWAKPKHLHYLVKGKESPKFENKVQIEFNLKNSAYNTIKDAYRRLGAFQDHNEVDEFTIHMMQLLVGQTSEDLSVKDLYQLVRSGIEVEFGDIENVMRNLNDGQKLAIKSSRYLRGGLQIIHGPPGTGKTFLATQMMGPFLIAQKPLTVLVASPTNSGADDMAQNIHHYLQHLKTKHPRMKDRYVLRVHSPDTERDICRTQCQHIPGSQVILGNANAASSSASGDQWKAISSRKFQGVDDLRLQNLTFSVGYMIMAVTGLVAGTVFENRSRLEHQRFRQLYTKSKIDGKIRISEEDIGEWNELYEQLFGEVVANASAIVSTTHGSTAGSVLKNIKHKVAAVFLEENAYEREDALAPIFATKFDLDPCLVISGDHKQLGPLVKTARQSPKAVVENAFAEQLELPFMARQIALGRHVDQLTEQYRMVSGIAELPNNLTYSNLLTNAPSTSLEHRLFGRIFSDYAASLIGWSSNRLLINIPPAINNQTEINSRHSKCNQFMVCVVNQILEDISRRYTFTQTTGPTIAILTPYVFQKSLYRQLKQRLIDSGHALGQKKTIDAFTQVDRLTVGTIDSNQGREFDIVILDIPVSKYLGFLGEEKRWNMALSRARDGLVLVCDLVAIRGAIDRAQGGGKYLSDMLDLFVGRTWNRPKSDAYPHANHFQPSPPHLRHDSDSDAE